MPLSHQQPPIAAAALLAGTLLAAAPGEALAPHAAGTPLAACRPAHIEAAAPPLTGPERRLARYLARRYVVALAASEQVVQAAYAAAEEVGLDPLLLLAVAAVESSFNPLAESVMGAKGLMQIIPKWHRDKLARLGGDEALFDPEANILLGAIILKEYVRRTGNLEAGLQFYNGAFFDPTAQYARKVMAERARLEAVLRGVHRLREATLSARAS
ncbi:MAG TPA: lytic transglycosylase domain-containing protein [Burkholderiales bacterium]